MNTKIHSVVCNSNNTKYNILILKNKMIYKNMKKYLIKIQIVQKQSVLYQN